MQTLHIGPGASAGRAVSVLVMAGMSATVLISAAGASPASEKAQAKKALLVLSDMPKGWTKEKGAVSGQYGLLGGPQVATCLGDTTGVTATDLPEVDSPYFQNKAQSLEVQDSIAVYPSTKNAKIELADLSSPKAAACMTTYANGPYKAQVAASAGKGTTAGAITVTSTNALQYGKGAAGYVVSLPITSQGASIVVTVLSLYFMKGTLGQQITLNTYGASSPPSFMKHLASVAMGRL